MNGLLVAGAALWGAAGGAFGVPRAAYRLATGDGGTGAGPAAGGAGAADPDAGNGEAADPETGGTETGGTETGGTETGGTGAGPAAGRADGAAPAAVTADGPGPPPPERSAVPAARLPVTGTGDGAARATAPAPASPAPSPASVSAPPPVPATRAPDVRREDTGAAARAATAGTRTGPGDGSGPRPATGPDATGATGGPPAGGDVPAPARPPQPPDAAARPDRCPRGHRFASGARGWLGPGCCTAGRVGPAWAAAVAGAAAAALLAARLPAGPELAVWLLLVPVGVLLSLVDLAAFRLPDAVTLPAAAGTAVLLGAAALLPGHHGSWPRALLAGAVLGAGYFVLFFASPNVMGLGDVKLAPTVGLVLGWYGWRLVLSGTLAALLVAGVVAAALLALRRVDRKAALPFGPPMLVGAVLALALAGGAG